MSGWTDILTAAALQPWMQFAPALLLAALRWLGCLLWLPGLGAAGVSVRMRIVLAVLLAIVMLPAVGDASLARADATSLVAWLGVAASELVVGSMLGLGVRILFAALALAGELIDHQAGLALRQVLDPAVDRETGTVGNALAWLGAVAVLLSSPGQGDFPLVSALLDQFAAVPLGSVESVPGPTLLIVLVQQSFCLALEVAAPILAAMSLITLAAGWLGRSAPRLPVGSVVAPIRIVVCLAMLTFAVTDLGEVLGGRLDAVVNLSPQLLGHSPGER